MDFSDAISRVAELLVLLAVYWDFVCISAGELSLSTSSTVKLCSPGQFFNPRTDECEPCLLGYFQPDSGRNTCLKCPHEWTTSSLGSTNESDCFPTCPAGFFFDHASRICEPCGLRGYQPESGSDRCIPCPSTTVPLYLNSTRIDHCLEKCLPGWQRSVGGGRCESCPIGSFKSVDDVVCMLCPNGWTTLNRGSKNINECRMKTCYPGTYLNATSGSCAPCDYGLYMDEYDGRICKVCPVSTTTYQTGSNSITQCLSTNQCKSGAHTCHWLAACMDLPDVDHKPRYSCRCKPGFLGNGHHCTDACEGLCYNGATCFKTGRGETRCVCQKGHIGRRCEDKI